MASEQDYTQNGNGDASVPRKMLILYGSETGNSEDAAGDIERMAMRLQFQTSLEEMNDIELSDLLRYSLVVFVVATTGQGELPKNARKFWKSLLRKRLQPGCLSQVNFTTFGLGDSSYFQYNWAARKLDKRLKQLGAVEFLPRGEADERHEDGIDGTLLSWCHTLGTYLEKEYPLPPGLSPIPPDVQLPPKFTLELTVLEPTVASIYERASDRDAVATTSMSHSENTNNASNISNYTATSPSRGTDIPERLNLLRDAISKHSIGNSARINEHGAPVGLLPVPDSEYGLVMENTRVTPDSHWQDVRSLRLLVPNGDNGKRLDYFPGDVAVIYPKNFPQDVDALIDLMGWGDVADKPFIYQDHQSADTLNKLPRNCYPLKNSTLRELLIHNYDITCIPRRSFFTQIACYTDDPTHKQRLRDFGNPVYTDEFYDYTSRPRRSTLEVLQDFPTVQIPYQHIPAVFPVIRGREYSIASGGKLKQDSRHPDATVIELLIALVKYKTVLRKTRHGLCSRYIGSLAVGTPISLALRGNYNRGLSDVSAPLIAIAPGTGVAPIRALLHDRNELRGNERGFSSDATDSSSSRPESFLFYGGRNRAADFYFENEWLAVGANVVTAFSRDQQTKIYVQDRLLENHEKVCALLRQGAIICLCGSSGKMPAAVRQALYDCMVKGGMAADQEQAKEILHKKHLFWEEVW